MFLKLKADGKQGQESVHVFQLETGNETDEKRDLVFSWLVM